MTGASFQNILDVFPEMLAKRDEQRLASQKEISSEKFIQSEVKRLFAEICEKGIGTDSQKVKSLVSSNGRRLAWRSYDKFKRWMLAQASPKNKQAMKQAISTQRVRFEIPILDSYTYYILPELQKNVGKEMGEMGKWGQT